MSSNSSPGGTTGTENAQDPVNETTTTEQSAQTDISKVELTAISDTPRTMRPSTIDRHADLKVRIIHRATGTGTSRSKTKHFNNRLLSSVGRARNADGYVEKTIRETKLFFDEAFNKQSGEPALDDVWATLDGPRPSATELRVVKRRLGGREDNGEKS
ncbi:hypothetical protein MD484_g5047, partial [Candolleomyces efflorescens]